MIISQKPGQWDSQMFLILGNTLIGTNILGMHQNTTIQEFQPFYIIVFLEHFEMSGFIDLYSWSRFFLPTWERAYKGVPRAPRGPRKIFSSLNHIYPNLDWKFAHIIHPSMNVFNMYPARNTNNRADWHRQQNRSENWVNAKYHSSSDFSLCFKNVQNLSQFSVDCVL